MPDRDTVISMARQSHLDVFVLGKDHPTFVRVLEDFASLVSARTREECAAACDGLAGRSYEFDMGRLHCQAAIRALGKRT